MKKEILYCRRCREETTFIERSDSSGGERIMNALFSIGFSEVNREEWAECTKCGYCIFT